MTLVADHSGKAHTRKTVTIKDVIVNRKDGKGQKSNLYFDVFQIVSCFKLLQ